MSRRKELLAELKRLRDPVASFVPYDWQKQYLCSRAHYRMVSIQNQKGKSYMVCQEIVRCLRGESEFRPTVPERGVYYLFVPSRDQVAEIYGRMLLVEAGCDGPAGERPMLDVANEEVLVQYVRTGALKLPDPEKIMSSGLFSVVHTVTRNTVRFFYSGYAKVAEHMRGKQLDGMWIDETAGRQTLIDELSPRLMKSADRHPGGGFLTWVLSRVSLNPAAANMAKICRDENDEDSFILEHKDIRGSDDPISAASRERAAKIMSKTQAKIRMGDGGSLEEEMRIYPELEENREHLIRSVPYQPTDLDNIVVSYDIGVTHPTALIFAHLNSDSPRKLRIKQGYLKPATIPEVAQAVREYLCGRKMAGLVYDKHGNRMDGKSGRNTIEQLAEMLDDPGLWSTGSPTFLRVDQHWEPGVHMVKTYLDPPPEIYPDPMLEFDPFTFENDLEQLWFQLNIYSGKPSEDSSSMAGVLRKGEGDDYCDALRLMCMAEFAWFDYGPNLPSKPLEPGSYIPQKVLGRQETEKEREERIMMEKSAKIANLRRPNPWDYRTYLGQYIRFPDQR